MCDAPAGPVVVYDHALTLCEPCATEYAAVMDDTAFAKLQNLRIVATQITRQIIKSFGADR